MKTPLTAAVLVLVILPVLDAKDWPQFRADATLTGYRTEPLPDRLRLDWINEFLHPPRPCGEIGSSLPAMTGTSTTARASGPRKESFCMPCIREDSRPLFTSFLVR